MQNASLDVTDLLATNGILHILSQVRLEGSVLREPSKQNKRQ